MLSMFIPKTINDKKTFFDFEKYLIYICQYQAMKKALTLFLLSIFLFNAIGYFLVYKVAQYQLKGEVKLEIKSGIDSDELKILTINKNNLKNIEWLEAGKEMRYNKQLYDIVKSTETSSAITFYCINDTKEESLIANLDEHINTHIAANKPVQNQKKVIENVIKLYFSNVHSAKFNVVALNTTQFLIPNLIYSSTLIEADSPPPKSV